MSDTKLVEVKNKLNEVGCGFCLAKWTQVTMHLHNGLTHSCHHPTPHKIPLSELSVLAMIRLLIVPLEPQPVPLDKLQ